jgi:zinc transport system substrate-binding protein
MIVFLLAILSIAAMLAPIPLFAATPEVTASIQPIHSLAASVMQGVATPSLLISGNQSPHHLSLRPSQMRQLSRADLVLWVGPILETPVGHILHADSANVRHSALIDVAPLDLLPARRDLHAWSRNHDDHDPHAAVDPHVWLSPQNARALVQYLGDRLQQLDPEHASQYRSNVLSTLQRIDRLDEDIEQQLASLQQRPFVVFHDAYQYFERTYGLQRVAAITINPQRLPGARRIAEIRKIIAEKNAVCLFDERQFDPRIADTIAANSNLNRATLDPIGVTIEPGPDAWFEMMRQMTQSFVQCLSPTR